MTVKIRREKSHDHDAVRRVNEETFGRADEARLVDRLRESGAEPLISLLADAGEVVVGHILFTPVTIEPDPGLLTLGLAPMAVLPEHQRQGIGSRLVEAGFAACEQAGADAVVVLGHPEYYPRFGFVPAWPLGLTCEFDAPVEAFMVRELKKGCFDGVEGLIRYRREFGGTDADE